MTRRLHKPLQHRELSRPACARSLKGEASHHKHDPLADNCILHGVDDPTPAKARKLLLEREIALARDEARTAAAMSSPTTTSPPPPPPSPPPHEDNELDVTLEDPLKQIFVITSRSTGAASPRRTPVRAMASPPAALTPPPLT